jgi:hypothetical protein
MCGGCGGSSARNSQRMQQRTQIACYELHCGDNRLQQDSGGKQAQARKPQHACTC